LLATKSLDSSAAAVRRLETAPSSSRDVIDTLSGLCMRLYAGLAAIEKRVAQLEGAPAAVPPIAGLDELIARVNHLDELAARVYRLEAAPRENPAESEQLERRLAELERKIRHPSGKASETDGFSVAMVKNGLCEAAEAEPAARSRTSSPTQPAPLFRPGAGSGSEQGPIPATPAMDSRTATWPTPGKPVDVNGRAYPSHKAFYDAIAERHGLPKTLPQTWHLKDRLSFEEIETRAEQWIAPPPGPRPGRPLGSPNRSIDDPLRKRRAPPLRDEAGNIVKRPRGRPLGWRKRKVAAIDPAA
jgi:hypothetical protein